MKSKWTRASALALSCHESIGSRATAHPELVGLLGARATAFQETGLPIAAPVTGVSRQVSDQQQATGGVRIARPRTTEMSINVQQPLNAYGDQLIGTSVSAAKGSLMAEPFATAKASGVPPRGRPA